MAECVGRASRGVWAKAFLHVPSLEMLWVSEVVQEERTMLMIETVVPGGTIREMVRDAMDELAAHSVDCSLCWAGVCDEGNTLLRHAMRVRAERDRLDARPWVA